MQELIRLRTFKERAEYLVNAWIRCNPEDYACFIRICEHERSQLRNATGMSEGGQFAYKGQFPTTLYVVMHNIEPNFGKDPVKVQQVLEMIMPKNTLPDLKKITTFNDRSMYEEDNARQANHTTESPDQHMFDREERAPECADPGQEPAADPGTPE